MAERVSSYLCPTCGTPRHDAMRYCASCAYDFWGAAAGRAPGTTAPVAASRPSAAAAEPGVPSAWSGAVWRVMAGGSLIVLGSVLPWVSTTSAGGELAFSGVDGGGEGWVTLLSGAGIIGLAAVARRGADDFNRLAVLALTLFAFAIFWTNLERVSQAVAGFEANARGLASASIGYGLWVLLAGVLVAFAFNVARPRAKGPGGLPNLLPF